MSEVAHPEGCPELAQQAGSLRVRVFVCGVCLPRRGCAVALMVPAPACLSELYRLRRNSNSCEPSAKLERTGSNGARYARK